MLSIKDKLVHRKIIYQNVNVCVAGCGNLESVNHLFFGCEFMRMSMSSINGLIFCKNLFILICRHFQIFKWY